MDYRKLTDADLVDFGKNVALQLAGHDVPGLDSALQDALAAALTPLNTSFETAIEAGVVRTAQKESAIADKHAIRFELITSLAAVRNYLVAVAGAKSAYELCGFTFTNPRSSAIVANDPSELAGEGRSNGVNYLAWSGNNKPARVVYEIWRRDGEGHPFLLHATTRKRTYQDTPVQPGGEYTYKVRAVAAKTVSNFSNTALIYGTL